MSTANNKRPDGQAAKTTPSHGVNPGSIPGQVITESNRYLPVAFLLSAAGRGHSGTAFAGQGAPPEIYRKFFQIFFKKILDKLLELCYYRRAAGDEQQTRMA